MRTGTLAAVAVAPLFFLVVLLARPAIDGAWENHPAHFWLVLVAALVATALGFSVTTAARRRRDARLFLISLAFIASAAFLGLHALATPGVLLGPNAGFELATPFGLLLAAMFAAGAALELRSDHAERVLRWAPSLLVALGAIVAVWATVSLAELPPLDDPLAAEQLDGWQLLLAALGVALFGVAAFGFLRLYRRRQERFVLAMALAFVLLAEAMVVIAWAVNWQLSWWEWHILMLGSFLLIAFVARAEWHEERFSALYLDETLAGAREVSVVLADLAGYTQFSEARPPDEVAVMLNSYFEQIIPLMEGAGGEVHQIVGDELMVIFGKDAAVTDHAFRAAERRARPSACRPADRGRARRLAAVPRRRVERRGPRCRRRSDAWPPQARRRRGRRESRGALAGGRSRRRRADRRGDVSRARFAGGRGGGSADAGEGEARARDCVSPPSSRNGR